MPFGTPQLAANLPRPSEKGPLRDGDAMTTNTETSRTAPVRSVDRTLDLLSIVCSRTNLEEGISLADCAKAANLPPSTALRFLRSLCQRGYTERDDQGLFHPGTEMLKLGANVLSRNNMIRVARPVMRKLAQDINESVYLVVSNVNGGCTYVAIEECAQTIRHVSWEGKSIPSEGSASGEVLTGKTKRGKYAYEISQVEDGVTAVASPVVVGDQVMAALTVLAPSFRVKKKDVGRVGRRTVESAEELSLILG